MFNTLPLLSLLIFIPLLGAAISLCCRTQAQARVTALMTVLLEFLLAIAVLVRFDPSDTNAFQLIEQKQWLPNLNIQYFLGIDGISVLFLPATALLGLMAIVASWYSVNRLTGFYYAMLLSLLGITMGVFLALDTMLFFLFWELTLPPIYFLISLWGSGAQRRKAAMKYTMAMMFGGIPLLFAFIMLAQGSGPGGDELVFSLPQLLQAPVNNGSQVAILALLVVGFAVKAPLFPFHTWLPAIAMESPAQITAILVGLKLGAYGLLRMALPLAPEAAVEYAWVIGVWGAFTMIYSAFIALNQSNLRRMLAYASISHVGLVVIGIAAMNVQSLQGAVFQLLNFTFVASGLMFASGFIQQRTGTTDVSSLGSLAGTMPRLAALFFILVMASIGIPGTSGFAAELLLILGAFTSHIGLGIVALAAIVLGAAYLLKHFKDIFWGPQKKMDQHLPAELKQDEIMILLPYCVLVLLMGFFPNLILNITAGAIENWLTYFP